MPKKNKTVHKPTGVYMPKKQNSVTKRRKKQPLKNIKRKGHKRPKRRSKKRTKILLLIIFSLSILGALIFLSLRFITNLRTSDENIEIAYIVGINDVPAYPGSEFIFENNIDDPAISSFISAGNSAYRLPSKTPSSKVLSFYDQKMPFLGWEKVLSVEIGSDEKKNGEYWLKDEKGLRIYSKFNDIWYEIITKQEAQDGLSNRVKEEIEREMILTSSDAQDLLPDFPWVIKIPSEYIISYSSGDFEDLRKASFKRIGSKEEILLSPIGYTGAKELDFFLEDYLSLLEAQTGIINTFVIPTPGLRGLASIDNKDHLVAVLPNYYNNVVYILHANSSESAFFEYLIENITEQDDTTF